jgi:hypothetical protein
MHQTPIIAMGTWNDGEINDLLLIPSQVQRIYLPTILLFDEVVVLAKFKNIVRLGRLKST